MHRSLSMVMLLTYNFHFSTFHCAKTWKKDQLSWFIHFHFQDEAVHFYGKSLQSCQPEHADYQCAYNLWTISEQHHLSMTVILRPAGSHMSLIFHMLLVQGTIDPHHSRFSCRFLLVLHLQNVSSAQLERYFAQKESDSRLRNLNSLFSSSVTNTYIDNRAWTLNSDNDR